MAVVRFATGARVMYKPRSLQVDGHFQQLLAWLNERGAHPALRTFWVVDREVYGWTEFVGVDPAPTATPSAGSIGGRARSWPCCRPSARRISIRKM